MTTFKNHGIPGGIQGYVGQLDSCCPTHYLPIYNHAPAKVHDAFELSGWHLRLLL